MYSFFKNAEHLTPNACLIPILVLGTLGFSALAAIYFTLPSAPGETRNPEEPLQQELALLMHKCAEIRRSNKIYRGEHPREQLTFDQQPSLSGDAFFIPNDPQKLKDYIAIQSEILQTLVNENIELELQGFALARR